MSDLIVYVDKSDVTDGKSQELSTAIDALVTFVEQHEPQLISYGFFVNETDRRMTVVAVHPDAASIEFHMDIAGGEFLRFKGLITLRRIEVYGKISERARMQLEQKAQSLGDADLVIDELRGGFARTVSPAR